MLESYNDVFSDIANVLLFKGETVVHPDERTERNAGELERDAAKRRKNRKISIAYIGLENQSAADDLPIRAIGKDSAEYGFRLAGGYTRDELYPAVTLVLYLGFEHRNKPKRLMECMDIPEIPAPYVNDYRIDLFEIAWLTPEDVKLFKSDFRYAADYFVQMRMTGEYLPQDDGGSIEHVRELFHALGVFTGNHRFEEVLARKNGEVSMTTVSGFDTYFELRYEQKFAKKKNNWLNRINSCPKNNGV